MDCLVCNSRSAVESCSKCQTLLCEMCSLKCEQCAKTVCPEHSYRTHSGRLLCSPCQEKRKERRAQQKAMAEGRLHDHVRVTPDEPEEESIEERLLTASVKKPMPPWQTALYISGFGLLLILIVLVVPSWRRFPLPWGGFSHTPYFFMVIPIVSVFWSIIGLKGKEFVEDRQKCYISLGITALACLLALVAVLTDPARVAELEAQRVDAERKDMTPKQLENWREQKLQKYAPPSGRKERPATSQATR